MAKVKKIKDNTVTIKGKENFMLFEEYSIGTNNAFIFLAQENEAVLLVIGDLSKINIGDEVKKTKSTIDISAKQSYFNNIISPLGETMFFKKEDKVLKKDKIIGTSTLFQSSPSILDRVGLTKSLDTGILVIDTMIPIGKGQRELIIGDRQTGKTAVAINTIINQKDSMKSIYVTIGQKQSDVLNIYNTLFENDSMKNTIIIYSDPNSPAEQFLSPMVGAAMAESIAYSGEDVLLIIDDLSKHANIYREISLSVGRNPGREAYPNDIFFMHSRVLERGGSFNEKYKNGSISILPIVETIEGDVASLIPSNIISITDGQIWMSAEKFNKGELPAVSVLQSVSRTGSSVQDPLIKIASKGLKTDYAKFVELKKFTEINVDVSPEVKALLKKSKQLDKILLQSGYHGYSKEMIVLLVGLYQSGKIKPEYDLDEMLEIIIYYLKNDPVGKKINQNLSKKTLSTKLLNSYIDDAIIPLLDGKIGEFNKIFSKPEFEKIMNGGK